MCYYVSITITRKDIEDWFKAQFNYETFIPAYSACGFTYPSLPCITNDNPHEITNLQWGLIPFWVKDVQSANKIRQQALNARSETIFEKPTFRHLIMSRRCLILVDGFFEWRHYNKKTYPYYIRLKNHEPFALAGIWDTWNNADGGGIIKTCSVITTRANPLLEKIHNTQKRMPVILTRENEKVWLDNADKDTIQSLLKSYQGEMEAHTVTKDIIKLGFNTEHPEAIARQVYMDLPD